MLEVFIPKIELFDDETEEFISFKEQTLQLEHSLVSISKWESKWCKPFLGMEEKTRVETIDYIRCMTITKGVNEDMYQHIPDNIIQRINDYINAPMTATTVTDINNGKKGSKEIVTSELIYYWMIAFQIPPEFEKWHLSRLMTLISVCNVKNQPPKKMSKREVMSRNAALNAKRKAKLNSKG